MPVGRKYKRAGTDGPACHRGTCAGAGNLGRGRVATGDAQRQLARSMVLIFAAGDNEEGAGLDVSIFRVSDGGGIQMIGGV